MKNIDAAIDDVVRNDLCSGCGACCQLDPGLAMELDSNGFARPQRVATTPEAADESVVRSFDHVCPGRRIEVPHRPGQREHPTMGRYLEAWTGWSRNPEIRHRGSSGGVITALVAWQVGRGRSATAATASPHDPRRTVDVAITSREEALATAGSRYAPASLARVPARDGVTVGKPCEIAALRQLDTSGGETERPLYLSFFCAGTPSQAATDRLVEEVGCGTTAIDDLWYRGRGWPGRFTVVAEGEQHSLSYEESWGAHLGRSLQWRCKICPDGVGELGDITAADFWEADEGGYPTFSEQDGRSAVIVRTEYGRQILREAIEDGVLEVVPLDLDDLAKVQPLQVTRRSTLLGRLAASRLSGRSTPRYQGMPLSRLALSNVRAVVRAFRASRRRLK